MMNSKMQKIVVAVLAIILAATMILTLIAGSDVRKMKSRENQA